MTIHVMQTTHALHKTSHYGWATRLTSVARESRPAVQLVFLMRAAAGSGLVRHPTVHAAVGVFGWVLLTMSIYLFNGVTDLTADSVNQSQRPIATGQLSLTGAVGACVGLAVAGLTCCLLVSWPDFVIASAMLLLGWAYSAGPALKNTPAGFAVVIGAGAALSYAAGWMAGGQVSHRDLLMSCWIAVWVGVCCASKDFSDADGDRAAGRRTWPVVLGAQQAARLLAILAPLTSTCFFAFSIVAGNSLVPAGALVAFSLGLAATALHCASAPDRGIRRRPYQVFMYAQYGVNVILMIFVTV